MKAFEREVKVEIVAPFSVGDGTTLNGTVEFQGLPAKIVGEI